MSNPEYLAGKAAAADAAEEARTDAAAAADDNNKTLPELFLGNQQAFQALQDSDLGTSDDAYQTELTRLLKSFCTCQRRVRGESIFSFESETVSHFVLYATLMVAVSRSTM